MHDGNREPLTDVWELLGKARRAEPSPFFARNVLRRIREEDAGGGFLGALRLRWQSWGAARWMPAAGAAVAMLAAVAVSRVIPGQETAAAFGERDFEVIAELDELLVFDHASVWLDPESVY